MAVEISDIEFKKMREYIEKECGILLGNEKAYLVESRLTGILTMAGCKNFSELYSKATTDRTLGLRDKIVDAMTTNETLWLRDKSPYEILENVILKQYSDEINSGKRRKIRIWSAACSTGQEPYSIAMMLQEFAKKHSVKILNDVEIIATDISPSALFLAMAARYDQLAISRGLSEDLKNRYFSASGRIWVLNDNIKKMVKFKKFNLQESFASLGKFDIVFLRNVAIYFSDDFKREIYKKIANLVRPSGYFFLGASESLTNYSSEYSTLLYNNKNMYYKVK